MSLVREEVGAPGKAGLSSWQRWMVMLASLPLAALAAQDAARSWWDAHPGLSPPAWIHGAQNKLEASAGAMAAAAQPEAHARQTGDAARAVLRGQPLDAAALRSLGFAQELTADGSGLDLLQLAERVSRRDLATQLALIEHMAQAGDVAATLRHYDRTLAVHNEADDQLFPILAQALEQAPIRQALIPYATRGWFTRFAYRALALGADPAAFSALLSAAGARLDPQLSGRLAGRTIGQLMADGRFDAAQSLAKGLPELPGSALLEAGFSAATTDPRLDQLGWRLAGNEIASAALEEDGRLAIAIASNRSGEVARRTMLLPPGTYRIVQTVAYQADTPRARLTWEVRCRTGESRVLGRTILPAAAGTHDAILQVPPGCPAQDWRLSATSALSQFASEAQLVSLVAEPVESDR